MIRGSIIKKPPKREAEFEASIHNRFDIEVIDAKTGKVRQKAQAFNVVCNNLWSYLFAGTPYFNYIHYGSGSGTPSTGDKQLFTYVGGKSTTEYSDSLDRRTGVYHSKRYIQVLENEVVGKTITEIGIAQGSEQTTLCTHAMLQDMNGNQISIEKTDTDIINIYATVYVHTNPEGYSNGSIWFHHHMRNCSILARIAGCSSFLHQRAAMGAGYNIKEGTNGSTTIGYGELSTISRTLTHTYDLENKIITVSMARVAAASFAGYHGIVRVFFFYMSTSSRPTIYPSMVLDAGGDWFPYSEIIGEAVGSGDGVTKDFALKFNFAHDAKVYIDGVETTDFTLDYGVHYDDFSGDTFIHMLKSIRPESTVDNHIPNLNEVGYHDGLTDRVHILYNKMYEIGLGSIRIYRCKVEASNDLENWEVVDGTGNSKTLAIPEKYVHYKYWRFSYYSTTSGTTWIFNTFKPVSTYTGKVLHFNTPPAENSVITVDYKSDTIAKDENHVFDLSVKIHLGEYTEAQ